MSAIRYKKYFLDIYIFSTRVVDTMNKLKINIDVITTNTHIKFIRMWIWWIYLIYYFTSNTNANTFIGVSLG